MLIGAVNGKGMFPMAELTKSVSRGQKCIPTLITPGVIAREVHAPLHRVLYILRTRRHIQPIARAGLLRLYERAAIAQVRYELTSIDTRLQRNVSNG